MLTSCPLPSATCSLSQLVGPTPLPSPLSSPLAAVPLLATTEAEEAAAAAGGREAGSGGAALLPRAEAESIPVLAATTHAATAVSAELASTSGKTRYGPSDFELLRVVGQGAFGKVRRAKAGGSELWSREWALNTLCFAS